jgi:SAM-dependent methyltransferase
LPPGPAAALDIGCGIGTLLAALAPRRADLRLTGIETAPIPFALAFLRTRKHSGVTVVRGDFFAYSWAEYDLVYAFLSPAPMRAVWEKARREMRPGSLFVSNSFTVPGREPECIVEVADRRRTRLLVFVIPALPAFAVDPPASRRAPAVRPARTPSKANRPPLFQPSPPSATDPPGGVAQAARIERRKPESAPPEPRECLLIDTRVFFLPRRKDVRPG